MLSKKLWVLVRLSSSESCMEIKQLLARLMSTVGRVASLLCTTAFTRSNTVTRDQQPLKQTRTHQSNLCPKPQSRIQTTQTRPSKSLSPTDQTWSLWAHSPILSADHSRTTSEETLRVPTTINPCQLKKSKSHLRLKHKLQNHHLRQPHQIR